MRRFAVVSCLLLALSLTVPFNGRVVHAAGATPIESIPVVRRSGVSTLSSSHADTFHDFVLDHGYHFTLGGTVVLNLGGAYTTLKATAYNVGGTCAAFLFQDVSDPATGIHLLGVAPVSGYGQSPVNVKIYGVTRLSVVLQPTKCSGNISLDTDLVGVLIGSPPRYVTPTYPSPNTVVPTNASVVFLWHGFPGATAYLLNVWLVMQSGTTAIAPTTRVSLSQLIFGHTSYTWDDKGFLPGTYQYDLLPLDRYGNALAGRSPAIQFTVAQAS